MIPQRAIKKEMREHPWASYHTAKRIAADHARRKKQGKPRRTSIASINIPWENTLLR